MLTLFADVIEEVATWVEGAVPNREGKQNGETCCLI